jgi:hypothetical protein
VCSPIYFLSVLLLRLLSEPKLFKLSLLLQDCTVNFFCSDLSVFFIVFFFVFSLLSLLLPSNFKFFSLFGRLREENQIFLISCDAELKVEGIKKFETELKTLWERERVRKRAEN